MRHRRPPLVERLRRLPWTPRARLLGTTLAALAMIALAVVTFVLVVLAVLAVHHGPVDVTR